MEKKRWLVLHTRPQWERIVCRQLEKWYGILFFCPFQKVKCRYSDRVKISERPVFKGYVFAEVRSYEEQNKILGLDGVVNFVRYLGQPAVIAGKEMILLRETFEKYNHFKVLAIEQEQLAYVKNGVFGGMEGIVKHVAKGRVILEIPLLGCKLEALIDNIEQRLM